MAESKDILSQWLEAQALRGGIIPVQFVAISIFILFLGVLHEVAFTYTVFSSFFPISRDDFIGRKKTLKANSISAI